MSALVTTPFGARATARDVVDGVDLGGRRYVVTGGGSGIGAETVRALAGAGADVVIGVRDTSRAQAFVDEVSSRDARGTVTAVSLDLADLASVQSFSSGWEGPLDGLVANAGIMAIPTRELTPGGWELQLATNFLGHFALASGLHDALASAAQARIAVVSSTAHLRSPFVFDDPHFEVRPYDRWAAYAQSKTADVLLAVAASRRWADDGITANALMPGWITTNLQRHLDDATLRAMGAMDETGNRIEQDFFKTPEQGAATSVLLVASPLVAGVSGRYFEDNQEAETIQETEGHNVGVAAHAVDPDAAERLWDYADRALRDRKIWRVRARTTPRTDVDKARNHRWHRAAPGSAALVTGGPRGG
ncbi:SDR family NAD(P)-dependent oxidoreductase [Nocardia sp. NPDC005745]|uniref:SDR family NAD(P)-dependent oxidoreductase n=1 Tax=Nocardia sp. NPDC005745 TaxID=3157061 RepID=UPI0033E43DF6